MKYIIFTILLLLPLNLAGEANLQKLSFIPLWSPQAQFTGYYVAYEKGIYKKYGLDITIIQGGPDKPSGLFLKDKKADVGALWLSTAIQMRSKGIQLINIGQIIQKSALILISKKSSKINTPLDLNGKRVSIWGGDFSIQPQALFKKYNLNVELIPQSYSVNLFLRGGVDAVSAMVYNEYHTILNSGVNHDEMNLIFYYEHGLNFPEDGIYLLEDTFKKDPNAACSFIKASIDGWIYSFENPDESIDIVLKYMIEAGVPANRIHQKWMLQKMKELIIPNDNREKIGQLNKDDYQMVGSELKNAGIINSIPLFEEFYKSCIDK